MKKLLYILPFFGLFACEDVIDLKVREGKTQLVVDAWLTDEFITQNVKLTLSQPYFDQSTPAPALGAEVAVITEDSTVYRFLDRDNTGNYSYTPRFGRFLRLNQRVALYIKYGGEEYYSVSTLKRVPTIDSLKYESFSFPITPPEGPKDGFWAQFYAHDFEGPEDTYLVRSIRNDTVRTDPNAFTLAYDAGLSPNTNSDGMLFLQPIRMSINNGLFSDRDKVTVELFSIPMDAFLILSQMKMEINNGGIFSTPPSNVPSNIFNRNPNSKEKAVGLFFVSKVNRFTAIIDKSLAAPLD